MNKTLDAVILRYVGFGLLFLGVLVALYLVRGALPIFLVGGLVAFALEPVLQKLEKRGYSRRGAVGFVFGVYLLLSLVLVSLLAAAFQQAQTLISNRETYSRQVTTLVESNRQKLRDSKLPAAIRQSIDEGIDKSLERLQREAPTYASNAATWAVGSLGWLFISVFLLNLVTLGIMIEAQRIRARLLMLVPPPYRRDMSELSHSINELLGRYVRGQMIVCSTYGALCTVAFEVLSRVYGLQYPLVLGALAACIYILPYFGPAIIFTSAGVTAYLTSAQPVNAAIAAVSCCIVFNLIVDYGIAPRVLGKGVGLHPLMVIFAFLCGFQLGGPLGTVVAVPVFASLRVIAIYLFPQLAAPLPVESPAAIAESEPHGALSESTKRVAEAEART
ncbi:MAG: AI-2E family transporter [Armatimonadetes bacterium]|nr:AI-2E family transporter [Armatimonadota bacterium]